MLEKLPSMFNAAKNDLLSSNYSKYEKDIIRSVSLLEKTALRARSIANVSFKQINMPLSNQALLKEIVYEAHTISIEEKENHVLKIIAPCTIPHYRESYKSMLSEPLRFALKEYGKTHGIPSYKSVVIVFVNYVLEGACQLGVRDNDNYDYKQLVNTIAYMTLPDDNYQCVTMMNGTKVGSRDCTEIYVIPKDEFSAWYATNGNDLFS